MFVDAGLLHAGAGKAHHAGERAHEAAEHLSRASVAPRMFGDFAAAEAFAEATGSMQAQHLRLLLGHRDILGSVGTRAHHVAAGFLEMEEGNARSIRAVRCASAS